ncbi:gliding motility-associated protein GldE [Taibaiella chishuiensis]|uniref:Gliding motility-associated protein GldE n=1 Tax=Taibaiella chishuiensis TaxID=1434707 RepID=A0A2P8DCG9_9BACT|nr:gliding motility-associated protein GldE [Taibaiella chishuiensis]PSK94913.1 gliding motility-associated protein GldE [Taibaiella chishuiensis]
MRQHLTAILWDAAPVILPATHVTAFIILVLALLFLTAVAAGAEVAFFTLNTKDVNYLKTKEQPGSRQVVQLLEKPDLLLSTLRASKYTLAIAVIITANYMTHIFLPPKENPIISFVVIFIGITFLLLLFGEILPKVYARENNVRLSLFSAPIVKVLFSIFRPAAIMLTDSTDYIDRKKARKKLMEMDSTEFEEAVELSMGHTATKEEVDIFKGIMKFGSITVKQIMHPRMDVNAIRESWGFPKVRDKMLAAGYSRMPVYKTNIDEIVGMVHTKDFLPYSEIDEFDWHSLIRPAYFVHQHKLIEDLLHEFQQKRIHFAVVVDEFGGTSGIVTLEDIMEEIIGDIRDEFDEDDLNFRKIDDNNYIFEGKMLINDMCRAMGLPFETFDEVRGESDSLAGLVLEISGKFPTVNERISYGDFDFTILSIEKLRIGSIKVERAV